MENIIVVEDDPVVWLDLAELLRASFSDAKIERYDLSEAFAMLRKGVRAGQALITATLPQDFDELAEKCVAGLKLVVTNSVSANVKAALPHAAFVERPFDVDTIIAALAAKSPPASA